MGPVWLLKPPPPPGPQIAKDVNVIIFVSQMWKWFGGGGCNVFLTFYAIRKKIWEYKTIIFYLMFSLCFFCMLEILKSAPSLRATG